MRHLMSCCKYRDNLEVHFTERAQREQRVPVGASGLSVARAKHQQLPVSASTRQLGPGRCQREVERFFVLLMFD